MEKIHKNTSFCPVSVSVCRRVCAGVEGVGKEESDG